MEPWESLDILEEDSTVLPRKRKNPLSPIKTNNIPLNSPTPVLTPCSLKSHSHSKLTPLIPGPAAAVQSARQRKTTMTAGEEPISTQEYIRRTLEDPCRDDEDFSRDTWFSALEFVRLQGLVSSHGGTFGTPLSEIKTMIQVDKVPLIVAIVKSCNPNGLGDLMVTLKDPTGAIDASIHRKVLSSEEFGNNISVGAVLVLQKVTVFSPCRSVHYLNITLSNIVKVIPADSGGPLQQNNPILVEKHASSSIESSEYTCKLPKPHSLSMGRTEGILNSLRQNLHAKGNLQNDKQGEEGKRSGPSSFSGPGAGRNQTTLMEKQLFLSRKDLDTVINDSVPGDLSSELSNTLNQVNHDHSDTTATNLVDAPSGEENRKVKEVKELKGLLGLQSSLPEWTDEQLDELFACD